MNATVALHLARFFIEAANKFSAQDAGWKTDFRVDKGRKYSRVAIARFLEREANKERYWSAYFFVDNETGDIYKAAGWKAPAKTIRYNIMTAEGLAKMTAVCDPHTAFLYIR